MSRPEDSPQYLAALRQTLEEREAKLSDAQRFELMLARGRVAAARKEEAKQRELAQINNAPPAAGYQPIDEFKMAAARMREREEAEAFILAQIDAQEAERERARKLRRDFERSMRRAKQALGEARFNAAMREARRRRGKK